jgi:hypothetical protein
LRQEAPEAAWREAEEGAMSKPGTATLYLKGQPLSAQKPSVGGGRKPVQKQAVRHPIKSPTVTFYARIMESRVIFPPKTLYARNDPMVTMPIGLGKVAGAAKRATKAANESAKQIELELVSYKTGDKSLAINIDVTGDTVWATQQQIADLFERDKRTISEHINSIIAEGELEESAVVRKFRTTASDGKYYEISHYDLDMILAVGFRVKSPKAAQFRKWAYQTLRSYIVDGYALRVCPRTSRLNA